MKHLLKQIWNERRSNGWLWVELLIVFVVLWYIVDWGYATAIAYYEPRGFDITNTYKVSLATKTSKAVDYIAPNESELTSGQALLEIAERLRRLPEVEAVSISQNSYPYCSSMGGIGLRLDSLNVWPLRRVVTPDFFHVFGYESVDGNGWKPLVDALRRGDVVVSENIMHKKAIDRRPLNRTFYNTDDSTRTYHVGAVSTKVRYSDFLSAFEDKYIAWELKEETIAEASDALWRELCLRVMPGTSAGFEDRLMNISDTQFAVGNLFIYRVESFANIRDYYQLKSYNTIKTRIWMMAFLLVNIFLGIIGTFWFRTQHRRSEIGLRMALGSSRAGLRLQLINEGLILLLLASIPAMIIAVNLGYADLIEGGNLPWTLSRFFICSAITLVLMAGMIVAGIWYPARQAMKVQPAEALHEE